ncbi:hypothetical protein QAD02_011604 [Eretmocerus hayati]|uniref:Uncharacterized protein n=1 Tax=Eretmocerus hayati TaxID=131215 RepID=A0ACC2NX71_9HYME|nr:hypothetical protein QAD02_011604 [Eretmocerus hayati]
MPIKKGTPEILDSNMNIFDGSSKLEREVDYRERYGKACECQACKENWTDMKSKSGVHTFYSEVALDSSQKSCKVFRDYSTLLKTNQGISSMEKLTKFSELIENTIQESPLPSLSTAFVIEGFISFIENPYGMSKPQVSNNCCT